MPKSAWIAVLVLLGSSLASAEEGLVAHWTFDEGDGKVLHDRSGLDNRGVIHGARWVLCGRGYALRFDGVDDYVECDNPRALDLRGPLTLSLWVSPQGTPSQEPGLIGKWLDSYALGLRRDQCYWYISGEQNEVHAPLAADGWHHVAGTFDGRSLRLYLDGVERAHADSKTDQVQSGRDFSMARLLPDPAATASARGWFAGMLDEAKLFSRALSAAEIRAEYNQQAAEKGRTPLAAE